MFIKGNFHLLSRGFRNCSDLCSGVTYCPSQVYKQKGHGGSILVPLEADLKQGPA